MADMKTPFSQRGSALVVDAVDAGDGMTLGELFTFVQQAQVANLPADTRVMVRVNLKANIKSMWTKK